MWLDIKSLTPIFFSLKWYFTESCFVLQSILPNLCVCWDLAFLPRGLFLHFSDLVIILRYNLETTIPGQVTQVHVGPFEYVDQVFYFWTIFLGYGLNIRFIPLFPFFCLETIIIYIYIVLFLNFCFNLQTTFFIQNFVTQFSFFSLLFFLLSCPF